MGKRHASLAMLPYRHSKRVRRSGNYTVKPKLRIGVRLKTKMGRSYSRTRTKKKNREAIIRPPVTGISHSYAGIYNKPLNLSKIVNYVAEPSIIESVSTVTAFGAADPGYQMVTTNPDCFAYKGSDISGLADQALTYLNSVGGGSSHPHIQSNQRSFKIYLNSCVLISQFANQGITAVEMEIYDLVSKVTSYAYIDPLDAWNTGNIDQQLDATTPAVAITPFSVPTASKKFNIHWRIVKRTKVELGLGRNHEHVFNYKCNRLIDTEYAATNAMIRGVTMAQLIVVRGGLCDTSTTQALGSGTLSSTKVIGFTRRKFISRIVASTPRGYLQVNNLPHDNVARYVENEGSGQPTLVSAFA